MKKKIAKIPWDIIYTEYMKGYEDNGQRKDYTYNEIAEKFNVKPTTLEQKAMNEHWLTKRNDLRLKENGLDCINSLVVPEDITPESVDAIVYDRLKLLAAWGKKSRSISLQDEKKLSDILINYKKILSGKLDESKEIQEKHNEKHLNVTINQLFKDRFQKPVEEEVLEGSASD